LTSETFRDSPGTKLDVVEETITKCGTLKRKKAAIIKRKKIPAIGHVILGIFLMNYTNLSA
jgi:hypothetical protein